MTSVNTNFGALVALQNLNSTNRDLSEVQNRISTGLRVSSAADDGAAFSIAQSLRSRVGSVQAINEGITRANDTVRTALDAGSQVSDILTDLQTEAQRAATFTNPADRQAAQDAFAAQRARIDGILNGAVVNGVNLLNGSNRTGFSVVTSDQASGSAQQTVQAVAGSGTIASVDFTGTDGLSGDTAINAAASGSVLANSGGANAIAVAVGDTLSFQLQDENGVAQGNARQVVISNFATLDDLAQGVRDATGGAVNLSFNGDRIVFDSDQNFDVNFESGVAIDNTTAGNIETAASANARAAFFGVSGGALANGNAAGTAAVAGTGVGSTAAQIGGGNQAASSSVAGLTTNSTLRSLITSGQTTGNIQLVVGDAGDQETVQFDLARDITVGQFLSEVSDRTGGRVTAAFDDDSNQIVFRTAPDSEGDAETLAVTTTNSAALGATFGAVNAGDIERANAGSSADRIEGGDFRVNGGAFSALGSIDLTSDPSSAIATIQGLQGQLNGFLGRIGSSSRSLETQQDFLTSLGDNLTRSIGGLVDADLARESARLQSLQVRQQLGVQALSIANQAPQLVLSFFR